MANRKSPFLLTTRDNRYNPFTSWIKWYMEDLRLGHDTCGLIARHTVSSDVFSDEDESYAMRTIIEHNLSGQHVMVVPEDFDPFLSLPF